MMLHQYDICAIGHVTKGIEVYEGKPREYIGGAPYFISIALKKLGSSVMVVTKIRDEDTDILLRFKEHGIEILNIKSTKTTSFRIDYGLTLDDRQIKVVSVADPFNLEDLSFYKESKYIYIGPLTTKDFSLEFIKEASKKAPLVLDVQGFTREVSGDRIVYVDWSLKKEGLKYVSICKLDMREAELLTGTSEDLNIVFDKLSNWGVKEVVLTSNKGVHLYISNLKKNYFAPFIVNKVLGRIGRGDTCLAAYLFAKLEQMPFEKAVKFAAAVTSLKLCYPGPLRNTKEEVMKFFENNYM
jgi:sugar/nucleoside kinase (ribokinase family)